MNRTCCSPYYNRYWPLHYSSGHPNWRSMPSYCLVSSLSSRTAASRRWFPECRQTGLHAPCLQPATCTAVSSEHHLLSTATTRRYPTDSGPSVNVLSTGNGTDQTAGPICLQRRPPSTFIQQVPSVKTPAPSRASGWENSDRGTEHFTDQCTKTKTTSLPSRFPLNRTSIRTAVTAGHRPNYRGHCSLK